MNAFASIFVSTCVPTKYGILIKQGQDSGT